MMRIEVHVDSLRELAERSETRFILAMFVDLRGKPCAKLVPVEAAEVLAEEGVGFAGYAVGAIGQVPSDPDIMAIPDVGTFTPIPFVEEGLAVVQCDPYVRGEPWAFAPRVILKKVIDRLADAGFEPWVGAEVEYFLVKHDPAGNLVPADADDIAPQPCYDARSVTRMYEHLTMVSTAMNTLGWGNYANDHEDANGQFEQNFEYADALTTADRVVTLRYLLNVMAQRRGMVATFMPKPFADKTGSGLHLHLSLTKGGEKVFPGEMALGLSKTALSFVAGLLEHAVGMQAVIAPTVNSYKRSRAVSTDSGATWAPAGPTYGGNDRTHWVRIPDDQRVELRGGDGSANPYLAIAVALAAGLDGITTGMSPGGIGTGPQAVLAPTLLHAVEAFEGDKVTMEALNSAGNGVAAYFAKLKKEEFFSYHAAVSNWEHDQYLTAF